MDCPDGVVPRRLLQAVIGQGLVFVVFFVLLDVAVFTHDRALVGFALVPRGPAAQVVPGYEMVDMGRRPKGRVRFAP